MSESPATDQPADPIRPNTNVITALAAITGDLGGIDKLTPDERRKRGMSGGSGGDGGGISYAYRGVDQIAGALQPLLGKHGVVIVPNVVAQHVEVIMVRDKPWTDTMMTVDWSIYGPGGIEDVLHARTMGLGRDNADKGPNKAITMAYKNLLLRLFSVGDPADDADHERVERDAVQPVEDPNGVAAREAYSLCSQAVKGPHADKVKAALADLREHHGRKVTEQALLDEDWRSTVVRTVHDTIVAALAEAGSDAVPGADETDELPLEDGAADALGEALS